ncbi:MAG: hypothetical protein AAF907_10265, partial [Planctomycetota bacterium]
MATSIASHARRGPERFRGGVFLTALAALVGTANPGLAGFEEDLAAVVAVGAKGEGSAAAAKAMPRLSAGDAATLPALLSAFEEAGPIGRNLLAGAVQAVADGSSDADLVPALTQSLDDPKLHPQAAAVAFELLQQANPAAS